MTIPVEPNTFRPAHFTKCIKPLHGLKGS